MNLMGEHPETLDEVLEIIREFVKERDWDKYNLPINLAVSLSIEVGELLEVGVDDGGDDEPGPRLEDAQGEGDAPPDGP